MSQTTELTLTDILIALEQEAEFKLSHWVDEDSENGEPIDYTEQDIEAMMLSIVRDYFINK